jgi:hypothetical protein
MVPPDASGSLAETSSGISERNRSAQWCFRPSMDNRGSSKQSSVKCEAEQQLGNIFGHNEKYSTVSSAIRGTLPTAAAPRQCTMPMRAARFHPRGGPNSHSCVDCEKSSSCVHGAPRLIRGVWRIVGFSSGRHFLSGLSDLDCILSPTKAPGLSRACCLCIPLFTLSSFLMSSGMRWLRGLWDLKLPTSRSAVAFLFGPQS